MSDNTGMGLVRTTKQLEQRRRKPFLCRNKAMGIRETARLKGASPGTISDWNKAYKSQGEKFFQAHNLLGRKSALSDKHSVVLRDG